MKNRLSCFYDKRIGALVFSLLIFYGGLMLAGITCPIKYLTGISCPGCGMTRACLSALQLRFSDAFAYHPLWIALLPMLGSLLLCWRKQWIQAARCLIIVSVLAMLITYLVRLLGFYGSDVVVYSPRSGAFFRMFSKLFSV